MIANNVITEADAIRKACPQMLPHVNDGRGQCIASECMAWRWESVLTDAEIEAIKRYRNEYNSSFVEAKDFIERHPEYLRGPPERPTRGFCGLAR